MPKALKSYPVPWKGEVLLACGKCQRKLRKHGDPEGLGKLRKALKNARTRLFVINTPCLDVCPRGGVTVCTRAQVAAGEFSVLCTQDDLGRLQHRSG